MPTTRMPGSSSADELRGQATETGGAGPHDVLEGCAVHSTCVRRWLISVWSSERWAPRVSSWRCGVGRDDGPQCHLVHPKACGECFMESVMEAMSMFCASVLWVARRGASSGRVCPCCGPGFSFRVSKGAPQPAKGLFLRTCICMKLHADKDSEVPAAVAVNRIHIVVRSSTAPGAARGRARRRNRAGTTEGHEQSKFYFQSNHGARVRTGFYFSYSDKLQD